MFQESVGREGQDHGAQLLHHGARPGGGGGRVPGQVRQVLLSQELAAEWDHVLKHSCLLLQWGKVSLYLEKLIFICFKIDD